MSYSLFKYKTFSQVEGGKILKSQSVQRRSGYAQPPTLFTHWDAQDTRPEIRKERIRKYDKFDNGELKIYCANNAVLLQGKEGYTQDMEVN